MKRILITGATGNAGHEVVRALYRQKGVEILAGMRDVAKGAPMLLAYPRARLGLFNVAAPSSQDAALGGCNGLFLQRPPQIPDDFGDLIAPARRAGAEKIAHPRVR